MSEILEATPEQDQKKTPLKVAKATAAALTAVAVGAGGGYLAGNAVLQAREKTAQLSAEQTNDILHDYVIGLARRIEQLDAPYRIRKDDENHVTADYTINALDSNGGREGYFDFEIGGAPDASSDTIDPKEVDQVTLMQTALDGSNRMRSYVFQFDKGAWIMRIAETPSDVQQYSTQPTESDQQAVTPDILDQIEQKADYVVGAATRAAIPTPSPDTVIA